MKAPDVSEMVNDMRAEVIDAMVDRCIPEKAFAEQWKAAELAADLKRLLTLDLPVPEWAREEGIDEAGIRERTMRAADQFMAAKAANFGPELMRFIEKSLLLQIFDAVWKEHLLALDHLRQGIGLRAYGQRDPLNEYKSEAFALFNAMLDEMKERVTMLLARVEIGQEPQVTQPPRGPMEMVESHPEPGMALAAAEPAYEMAGGVEAAPVRVTAAPMRAERVDPNDPSTWRSTPRNAPCPCGSGKKFKHCHGRAM
jgi:preprotein translocase subunit SecA